MVTNCYFEQEIEGKSVRCDKKAKKPFGYFCSEIHRDLWQDSNYPVKNRFDVQERINRLRSNRRIYK